MLNKQFTAAILALFVALPVQIKAAATQYVYSGQIGSIGSGNGQFHIPNNLAIDSSGNIWVSDSSNDRVQELSSSGAFIQKFGSFVQFTGITSVAVDPFGNVWVTETPIVQEFSNSGTFIKTIGGFGPLNGQFESPVGIAFDSAGNAWVADQSNKRIQEFSNSGTFIQSFTSLGTPSELAIDTAGNIYVSDTSNAQVEEYTAAGVLIKTIGTSGTGNGQFIQPRQLAIDSQGNVFVVDSSNSRVEEFDSSGAWLTQFGTKAVTAGTDGLSVPTGLALDSAGNVWVADDFQNRLAIFSPVPVPEPIAIVLAIQSAVLFCSFKVIKSFSRFAQ